MSFHDARGNLVLLCLGTAIAKVPPLLQRDFSAEIPKTVASQAPQAKAFVLPLGGKSEPTVKVTVQVLATNYIKTVTVNLDNNPGSHKVSAQLGNAINSGTKETPVMQVPLMLTWSRSGLTGKKSRTDLYQLSPQGCKKQSP